MKREQALKIIDEKIKNKNLKKHLLATEICMKELAKYFNEDQQKWSLAGLLHDIDYEETNDQPDKHGELAADYLLDLGLDNQITEAIRLHGKPFPPDDRMALSRYSVDPLTGLIIASVLMHPDRKLSSMSIEFLKKRFKEKRFAAGANREQIKTIEKTGLNIDRFFEICIKAMNSISEDLNF